MKLTIGKIQHPPRVLLYGPEKVGKSTFASQSPHPVWLGKDSGTEELDVRRLPQPETWTEVLDCIEWVQSNAKSEKIETLVVDPINWFEPLCTAAVLGISGKSINEWGGGYGAGARAVATKWRELIAALERVWRSGVGVVILAHSARKQFDNPEGSAYQRYEIDMSEKLAGPLKQWSDVILFAQRDAYSVVKDGKGKAEGTGEPMIHTQWRPAYDAGSRWALPETLPLSWGALMAAKSDVNARLEAVISQLDAPTAARVRTAIAKPNAKLHEILSHAETLIQTAEAS